MFFSREIVTYTNIIYQGRPSFNSFSDSDAIHTSGIFPQIVNQEVAHYQNELIFLTQQ